MELERVAVLLPGKQHQPLLHVPLSALVQVSPRRVPALIDGGIVPQCWKESNTLRASPWGYAHYIATLGQRTGFWALKPLLPC